MEKDSYLLADEVNLVDKVVNWRPKANRYYDQIYMMSGDMLSQFHYVKKFIANKNVVFLGDGDGMSMLFTLFAKHMKVENINATVLDFDERILNNILSFASEHDVEIQCKKYNVLSPIPTELHNRFDFFYINPPYGSKNKGLSIEIWLHRCLDLCSEMTSGCIIIPYHNDLRWTQEAMHHTQQFLNENGYTIVDMKAHMHGYHLKDNPFLKSATIIVEKVYPSRSAYSHKSIPKEIAQKLYGTPKPIPHYIHDDGSEEGTFDYDWEYGNDFWNEE